MRKDSGLWKALGCFGWVSALLGWAAAILLLRLIATPKKELPPPVPALVQSGIRGWYLHDLVFSPDGKLAYGAGDGAIDVFETESWLRIKNLVINDFGEWGVPELELSPGGKKIALIYNRKEQEKNPESFLLVYQFEPIALLLEKEIPYHAQFSHGLGWLDEDRLALLDPNGLIRVLKAGSGEAIYQNSEVCSNPSGLICNQKDHSLLLGCGQKLIAVDPEHANVRELLRLASPVRNLFLVQDGNFLAVIGQQELQVYALTDLRQVFQQGFEKEITDADYLPGQELLALGLASGWVKIVDLKTQKEIATHLLEGGPTDLIRLSPDGRWLVGSSKDYGGLSVWYLPALLRHQEAESIESLPIQFGATLQ